MGARQSTVWNDTTTTDASAGVSRENVLEKKWRKKRRRETSVSNGSEEDGNSVRDDDAAQSQKLEKNTRRFDVRGGNSGGSVWEKVL